MKVKQIYNLMNTVSQEILGNTDLVQEDLTGVVQLGQAFEDAVGVENFTKTLVDHIGRMVFVDRVYNGNAPSILMDGWEFGSVLEKVSVKLPEAQENESWELEDGTSYDPNIFYKPIVTVEFFNDKTTFEIPYSITDKQVRSAFSDATQLNAFLSMLYNAVANSMTIKNEALIMRTVNALIGEVLHAGGANKVNLLERYNTDRQTQLTVQDALHSQDFMLYAMKVMNDFKKFVSKYSTQFTISKTAERFTPESALHFIMLDSFKNNADAFMRSTTFNTEFTKLPNAETVPYWQGTGTGADAFAFDKLSTINIKTPSNDVVTQSGVIGVMFDRDAVGVANFNPRTTTQYNAKAEFTNFWSKIDAQYFISLNENAVVFYMA